VLQARLDDLEAAAQSGDPGSCTRCDMALHRAIWRQAENPHLLRVLDSVLGAVFVLCDRARARGPYNADRSIAEHRQLIELIGRGDGEGAEQAMEAHLRNGLDASLRTLSARAGPDHAHDGQPG
jgi:DNA-binding GntR family transcriptional regulator